MSISTDPFMRCSKESKPCIHNSGVRMVWQFKTEFGLASISHSASPRWAGFLHLHDGPSRVLRLCSASCNEDMSTVNCNERCSGTDSLLHGNRYWHIVIRSRGCSGMHKPSTADMNSTRHCFKEASRTPDSTSSKAIGRRLNVGFLLCRRESLLVVSSAIFRAGTDKVE